MRSVSNRAVPAGAFEASRLLLLSALLAPASCVTSKGSLCAGGCSGHGVCTPAGQCICSVQWAGRDCSYFLEDAAEDLAAPKVALPSVASQCEGRCQNGRCVAGHCVCAQGFFGPSCADRQCANNCWGHGACSNGRCLCTAGWAGSQCELLLQTAGERQAALPVPQAAPQQPGVGRSAFLEASALAYQPRAAQNPSAFALNRARKAAQAAKTAADQLLLLAQQQNARDAELRMERALQRARQNAATIPGHEFAAANAKQDVVLLETPRVPQKVGLAQLRAGQEAQALRGSSGACGGRNCSGNGLCDLTAGRCQCFDGWHGEHCDNKRCPSDCSNSGVCIAGRCICHASFFGTSCQNKRCPNDCSGHGYCFAGRCQCTSGFLGDSCTELVQRVAPELSSLQVAEKSCAGNCSGHGSCRSGLCECSGGWSGSACSDFCPRGCSGHGSCVQGACLCHAGFLGTDCSTEGSALVQRKCPHPTCSGHGVCEKAGRCLCGPGYSGPICSDRVIALPASCPRGCSGHGSCTHGICLCSSEWGGDACDTPKPAAAAPGLAAAQDKQQLSVAWHPQASAAAVDSKDGGQAAQDSGPVTAAWMRPSKPAALAQQNSSQSAARSSAPAQPNKQAGKKLSLLGMAGQARTADAARAATPHGSTVNASKINALASLLQARGRAANISKVSALASLLQAASRAGAKSRAGAFLRPTAPTTAAPAHEELRVIPAAALQLKPLAGGAAKPAPALEAIGEDAAPAPHKIASQVMEPPLEEQEEVTPQTSMLTRFLGAASQWR